MAGGIRADSGRSYCTIEDLAAGVREVIVPGIRPIDPLDCMALFEGLDRFTVSGPRSREIPLTYAVQEYPIGVEGVTRYDEPSGTIVVSLSTQTYQMLEAKHPRARFAVAHEVGHAVLHGPELVRLAEIPHGNLGLYRRAEGRHDQCFDTEWQANGLAAALLMPAPGLSALERRGQLTRIAVQTVFKVSAQAAEIRIDIFRRKKAELL